MCLRGVIQAFSQDGFGTGVAFAAARANTELLAQLGHGCHACIDRLMNLAFRDIITNTYDHCTPCRLPEQTYTDLAPVTIREKNLNFSG